MIQRRCQRAHSLHGERNDATARSWYGLPRTRNSQRAGRDHHRSPFYSSGEDAEVKFQVRQLLVQELSQFFLFGLQGGLHLPETLRLFLGAASHRQTRHKASPGLP